MDRDVTSKIVPDSERCSVKVKVRNPADVHMWIRESIPETYQPSLTQWEDTKGMWVIKATFNSRHYGAMFRLFWG